MSRNLCQRSCYFCSADEDQIVFVEEPRLITETDAGPYYRGREDQIVANAECSGCGAKYLAWVDWPSGPEYFHKRERDRFSDLSFRSTFNDEWGPEDLPTRRHRITDANVRSVIAEREWDRWRRVSLHLERELDKARAERDRAYEERDAAVARAGVWENRCAYNVALRDEVSARLSTLEASARAIMEQWDQEERVDLLAVDRAAQVLRIALEGRSDSDETA